jgi:hypothetical protein
MGLRGWLRDNILRRYHYLAKYYYRHWHYRDADAKAPLLVYQMGKVGSTSVEMSLRSAGLAMPIFHVHLLSPIEITKDEMLYHGRLPRLFAPSHLPATQHLFNSYYIRRRINRGEIGAPSKWKIVTLTRDPIARNISGFFEGMPFRLPQLNKRLRAGTVEPEELVDYFFRTYDHEVPLTWFDDELKSVFGIDVYSSRFPTEKGYQILSGELVDVLVIRLESLQSCIQDAMVEFLGLRDFSLKPVNEGSKKEYGGMYSKVLSSIVVPASYIDMMYTSRYATHFYAAAEVSSWRAKWSNSAARNGSRRESSTN